MVLVKKGIDLGTAQRAVAAAAEKAAELGLKMCIAVSDESGDLKAFARMDGAPKLSIGIAEDKAFTAASYSMPTHVWYEFIKDDPPLLHGAEVMLWAAVYAGVGAVADYPTAVYHSIAMVTTTGSDVAGLNPRWKLLGGVQAIGGWLLCSLSTAFLFTVMQRMRPLMPASMARGGPARG